MLPTSTFVMWQGKRLPSPIEVEPVLVPELHQAVGAAGGHDDDVVAPVAGHVAGRDVDAAAPLLVDGHERADQPIGDAVEGLHERVVTLRRTGDDVGVAVAGDVAERDRDAVDVPCSRRD